MKAGNRRQLIRTLLWISLAVLLLSLGTTAFGQDLPGRAFIDSLEFRFQEQKNGISTVIQGIQFKKELQDKPFYKQGNTTIWPLINLDIFGKVPLAWEMPKMTFNPEISVRVPLAKLVEKTGISAAKMSLYFYVDNKWVPGPEYQKKYQEIAGYKIEGDYIVFKIIKWPIDDRMIGAGG